MDLTQLQQEMEKELNDTELHNMDIYSFTSKHMQKVADMYEKELKELEDYYIKECKKLDPDCN